MPIGLGLGLLLSGLIGGGTSLLGAKMQSSAASKGQKEALAANDRALAFERERDARDYQQYLKELDRQWRIQDEDRGRGFKLIDEREARMAPFREGAANGYKTLSSLLTLPHGYQTPGPISPAARPLTELLRA